MGLRSVRGGDTVLIDLERAVRTIAEGVQADWGDDLAAAVAFLAFDDTSYVTGHTLGDTGGVVMR